ncbi:MAG: hypothetical protein ACK5D5_13505 [Bacteroidota bacterium]|jgi:hypothetical protein
MSELESKREKRIDDREAHHHELQKSLDRFSISLIKVVGVVSVIMGLIIIGVFWYWVISKMF